MKFIIGLGNPGAEYKGTKHNIGFAVVDALAKEYGIKVNKERCESLTGKGRILDESVMLIEPQTYMNLSGKAVEEILREEKADNADILVICDDINLEVGKIRIKKRGSAGGHKGLESIIKTLGSGEFMRLRVGIATEAHKGDITNYVLTPFKRKDLRNVSHLISLAKDAVICLVENGPDKAMAKFNKKRAGTS